MKSRRLFLRESALAGFGIGTSPLWLERALAAPSAGRKSVLVVVFQRGAADGLNMVIPFAEPEYFKARPTIALKRDEILDLDGFFGLHPSLGKLLPLFQNKALAAIHAAGSPDPTRSHFDAQDYMESGTPGQKSTSSGWLNRVLPVEKQASALRAVSIGPVLPRAMRGSAPAVALDSLDGFSLRGGTQPVERMYKSSADTTLQSAGREMLEAIRLVEDIRRRRIDSSADYPKSKFGRGMRQIAEIIKAGAGLEVAFCDVGGWDHHVNEAGQLQNMLQDFGDTLAAFWQDLGDQQDNVLLLTISEFGRTVRENGTRGTDHGHANVMLAMGAGVRGGKIYGPWPGLKPADLHEGRDLRVTTDFRLVLSEAVERHLGRSGVAAVFPGFRPDGPPRGFLPQA